MPGGRLCRPAGRPVLPASEIGTSRFDVIVAATGNPFAIPSFKGKLYNAEPLGNEPGRLAAVTLTPLATLVSSIPFEITPQRGE